MCECGIIVITTAKVCLVVLIVAHCTHTLHYITLELFRVA